MKRSLSRNYAIVILVCTMCFGCKAQNKKDLLFSLEPVYLNSVNRIDNRMVAGKDSSEMTRDILHILIKQPVAFDSAVGFITNFRYQKDLMFRYEDTAAISSSFDLLAFRIFMSSFLFPVNIEELVFSLQTSTYPIEGLGDGRVYEISMAYKNPASHLSPSKLFLLFPQRSNVSKLPVTCTALFADTLQWRRIPGRESVTPVLGMDIFNRSRKSARLLIPLVYESDHRRFVPIAHYVVDN